MFKNTEITSQAKTHQAFAWKSLRPSTSTAQQKGVRTEKTETRMAVTSVWHRWLLTAVPFHLSRREEKGF